MHAAVPGPRPVRLAWEQVEGPRVAGKLGVDVWHGPHYTLPLRARIPTVVHRSTTSPSSIIRNGTSGPKVLFFPPDDPGGGGARVGVRVREQPHRTPPRPGRRRRPATDVMVIHHGVDHERFAPDGDEAADLRALAAVGVVPPYAAFRRDDRAAQEHPGLIDAFASRASDPGLQLVLAGGGG